MQPTHQPEPWSITKNKPTRDSKCVCLRKDSSCPRLRGGLCGKIKYISDRKV